MTGDSGNRPSIRDMFQIPMVGGGRISPDGDRVIYRLAYVDNFDDNQLEVYAYLYDSQTGNTHQFTRSRRVTEVRWVDNQTLALLKPADNTSFQIHVFEGLVGEGQQITDHPGGIGTFEPFGNGFIYIARRTTEKQAAREKKYGTFVNVEEEESLSALYYIDSERILDHGNRSQHSSSEPVKPIVELSKLLERPFKIESAIPSPNNDAVFINCRSREDEFYENDTYCFKIELDPDSIFDDEKATAPIGRLTPIALPKGARVKAVSPDGAMLLVSYKESGLKGRVQADLWLLELTLVGELSEEPEVRKHLRCITGKFDQEPLSVYWTRLGIFLSYWNESTCGIARLSETGEVEAWDIQGLCVEYFHVNDDGAIFLRALSPTALAEIYYGYPNSGGWALRRITDFNERYADWDFGTVESIRWTSRDGAEIEGILRKPSDFDPNKKYPDPAETIGFRSQQEIPFVVQCPWWPCGSFTVHPA